MAAKITGLIVVTVLLSAVIICALETNPLAEAKPISKSAANRYNKWVKNVCGDELCPGVAHVKTVQRIANSSPNR